MSPQNVPALEDVYAKWRLGSFSTPEIFDPQVEVKWYPTGPDTGGTTTGIAEMAASFRRWFEVLSDVRFEAERFVDLGEQVLVFVVMHARARHSGLELSDRYGHLWTFCDGRAIRLEDADADRTSSLLARRFIELGRKGDWGRLDLLAEDVVYRPIAEITEAGEYHGREGFRRYMEDFFESDWARDLTLGETTFRDQGNSVVVRIELTAKGRGSGLDFGARVFEVLTFSDGRIVRIEDFLDRDDAMRAAGR